MKTKLLRRDAFTLIELLVVIAILGVLVILAAPRLLGYIEKTRVTHIQHDVKLAEDLMSEYLMKSDGNFPNEWPDMPTSRLINLAANSELYDVTGFAEEVADGNYREIDKDYLKDNMSTRLGGTFYSNESGKVFYEDTNPSDVEYKDDLFDREVNESDIEQDKIQVLNHNFPNGIYHDGETMIGNVEVEGIQADDYYIEFSYIHSKFGSELSDTVEFYLEEDEINTINFELLVEPYYMRGFYDFSLVIKDSDDNELISYDMNQVVYFAETEWIYYYEDDLNAIDRPVAGQIGSLSSDRVEYEYVHEEVANIDYSSITFNVEPNDNRSGQINTILPQTYGSYEAMIKVPDSDALLNGFFLYGHNEISEVEHEIDIEILYEDGKWQAWGTIFNETHKDYVYDGIEPGVIYQSKLDLDFDPTLDYHSYRIDFYDDFVSFAVDGIEFGRWENEFDYGDMRLYTGNFYTHWLTGELSEESLEMNVKWMRKGYFE